MASSSSVTGLPRPLWGGVWPQPAHSCVWPQPTYSNALLAPAQSNASRQPTYSYAGPGYSAWNGQSAWNSYLALNSYSVWNGNPYQPVQQFNPYATGSYGYPVNPVNPQAAYPTQSQVAAAPVPAMACRGRCFTTYKSESGESYRCAISHQQLSYLGMTWYFCPAHRVYHCFATSLNVRQPLCGECAVVFFFQEPFAAWLQEFDKEAGMSNAEEAFVESAREFAELQSQLDQRINIQDAVTAAGPGPPENLQGRDVLSKVPWNDPTFLSISGTLIPHTRLKNVYLMEFRTFVGTLAFQPCGKDIDLMGLFRELRACENGDPLFSEARAWACVQQAVVGLPIAVR